MIVLDTNVLSEEMRPTPDARVHAWLRAQDPTSLFTTAVTEAELHFGVAALPDGKRKAELGDLMRGVLALFGDRVCRSIGQQRRSFPSF